MTAESTEKPRRKNTKERIIDEAERLAAFHGIEHLKLQDLAENIGIKLPSVYAHFSGREDILSAMSARVDRALVQLFVLRRDENPIDCLQEGALALADLLTREPARFRLMLRDLSVPLGYDPVNRRLSIPHGHQLSRELKEMIQRVNNLLELASVNCTPVSPELFLPTLIGSLLVNLAWLDQPLADNPNGRSLDQARIKYLITELTHRLLFTSAAS